MGEGLWGQRLEKAELCGARELNLPRLPPLLLGSSARSSHLWVFSLLIHLFLIFFKLFLDYLIILEKRLYLFIYNAFSRHRVPVTAAVIPAEFHVALVKLSFPSFPQKQRLPQRKH